MLQLQRKKILFHVAASTHIVCVLYLKKITNTCIILVWEGPFLFSPHYSVIKLPYTSNGIQIAPYGRNIRLVAKLMEMELVVMWNNDDYLMVSKMLS